MCRSAMSRILNPLIIVVGTYVPKDVMFGVWVISSQS